MTVTSLVAV